MRRNKFVALATAAVMALSMTFSLGNEMTVNAKENVDAIEELSEISSTLESNLTTKTSTDKQDETFDGVSLNQNKTNAVSSDSGHSTPSTALYLDESYLGISTMRMVR